MRTVGTLMVVMLSMTLPLNAQGGSAESDCTINDRLSYEQVVHCVETADVCQRNDSFVDLEAVLNVLCDADAPDYIGVSDSYAAGAVAGGHCDPMTDDGVLAIGVEASAFTYTDYQVLSGSYYTRVSVLVDGGNVGDTREHVGSFNQGWHGQQVASGHLTFENADSYPSGHTFTTWSEAEANLQVALAVGGPPGSAYDHDDHAQTCSTP